MRRLSWLFATAFLAACSSAPPRQASMPAIQPCKAATQPEATPAIDDLMQYYDRIGRLSPAALEMEHKRAVSEASRSDLDRMKAALLLSLPNTPFRDPDAALRLMTSEQSKDAGLRSFSSLLEKWIEEARALEKEQERIDQMLKEEKRQIRILKDKINAIKEMEKTLDRVKKR